MRQLSRTLGRWDPIRVASIAFGASAALVLAAYVVDLTAASQVKAAGVVSAVVLLAIAASGLLYAWRPGAGGLAE